MISHNITKLLAFHNFEFVYATLLMPFHNVHNLIVFFPSVTHYVFVNFLFGGIGLSTINTHTAGWLFEFGSLSMPCINAMCFALAAFELSMS